MHYSKLVDLVSPTQYLLTRDSQKMHCIIPPTNGYGGIYLGSIDAANDKELLRKHNIKAVVSALSSGQPLLDESVQKLWIVAQDAEDFPLNRYFDQSNNFIDKHRSHTNILVHCQAGISRSTTLVAAYLINKFGWSTSYALKQISMVRKCICPNPGFQRQLEQFEGRLSNLNYESSLLSTKKKVQQRSSSYKMSGDFTQRFDDIFDRISSCRTQKSNGQQFRFDLQLDNSIQLKSSNQSTQEECPLYFSKGQKTNAEKRLPVKSFLTKSFATLRF